MQRNIFIEYRVKKTSPEWKNAGTVRRCAFGEKEHRQSAAKCLGHSLVHCWISCRTTTTNNVNSPGLFGNPSEQRPPADLRLCHHHKRALRREEKDVEIADVIADQSAILWNFTADAPGHAEDLHDSPTAEMCAFCTLTRTARGTQHKFDRQPYQQKRYGKRPRK
jgi:hypothetical protein